MSFAHRWYYFSVVIISLLLLGFFYQLKPQFQHATILQSKRDQMQHQLDQFKLNYQSNQKRVMPLLRTDDYIKRFSIVLHQAGLTARTISVSHDGELQFSLLGTYEQLINFLAITFNQANDFVINNFVIKVNEDKQLNMSFAILPLRNGGLVKLNHDVVSYAGNPFCEAGIVALPISLNIATQFTTNEMRLSGILQDESKKMAIIALPNNQTITVEVGSYLGKDQALITSIDAAGIRLIQKNKQIKIMTI